MEKFAYPEDCGVERNLEQYPGMAVLMDCEGDIVFVVPDTWEDHQLFMALDLANAAFRRGKKCGKSEKAREIQKALELK